MSEERARGEMTELLSQVRAGDGGAEARVIELAYGEMRRIAHGIAGAPRGGIKATSLVHEAWMKLDGNLDDIEGRRHFYRLAARTMRQVLVDSARAAKREKRGGAHTIVALAGNEAAPSEERVDTGALAAALGKLRERNARHADVLELRAFTSLGLVEIGELLGISKSSVHNDLQFARAWLVRELQKESGSEPAES